MFMKGVALAKRHGSMNATTNHLQGYHPIYYTNTPRDLSLLEHTTELKYTSIAQDLLADNTHSNSTTSTQFTIRTQAVTAAGGAGKIARGRMCRSANRLHAMQPIRKENLCRLKRQNRQTALRTVFSATRLHSMPKKSLARLARLDYLDK